MQKKSVFYYLGNVFLLASFIGFFYLFGPIIQIYLFPPVIQQILPTNGIFITIPKIHAQSPVIVGVDPGNQAVYDEALKHGVAQAKGTSLPGEIGTVYLFAHSSGPLWDETHFNTIFFRLGELKKGDTITIRLNGKDYHYVVRSEKVVNPTDVGYLTNNKRTQLIVQTCWPIGTSFERLLVFADPK
jgi:sortase A